MKSKKTAALATVKLCCGALDDKKAEGLTVLDVSEQSSITDYLVIATANSTTHLRALRVEAEKVLDAAGVRLVGMETAQESGWLVVDAFDVMLHLFLAETRERYGLERLWRDATELSPKTFLPKSPKPAARPKKAPATRKAKAKTNPKKA